MSEPKTLTYHSKLVGVTFEGRQDVIKSLRGKEPLRVRREKDNKYDPRAVAVDVYKDDEWIPIGYIAKDKNKDISETLDAGNTVYISIGDITGGGDRSYGVNISLEYKLTEEEAPEARESVPSKTETLKVLNYLTKAIEGVQSGSKHATEAYTSPLTGETIELEVVNGHKELKGFMSGSKFPEQFYQPFDREGILAAMAEKYNVDADAIEAMWNLNNEASTGYGTAIHAALENYDRNFKLGDKTKFVKEFKTKPTEYGPNRALSKNPFIKKIVEDFQDKFGGDYERLSEVFIWDAGLKLCGSIDRLMVVDRKKKIVRIQDFKTDGDIHEKKYQLADSPFKDKMGNELLDYHWLQLSFYAFLLEIKGYTIDGLDIYWLNPNKLCEGENAWEEFSSKPIDIREVIING